MMGAWLFFIGPWVTLLFVLLVCRWVYNCCWYIHLGWCIERQRWYAQHRRQRTI